MEKGERRRKLIGRWRENKLWKLQEREKNRNRKIRTTRDGKRINKIKTRGRKKKKTLKEIKKHNKRCQENKPRERRKEKG